MRSWYVLLDDEEQCVFLVMPRGIRIFPDMLARYDMLNNVELVSHGLYSSARTTVNSRACSGGQNCLGMYNVSCGDP